MSCSPMLTFAETAGGLTVGEEARQGFIFRTRINRDRGRKYESIGVNSVLTDRGREHTWVLLSSMKDKREPRKSN